MKVIFHMDLDSYFVSASRTLDKSLENKPVVISGGGNRSIIVAASYEAKKSGLKVGMPLFRAKILVPHLTVIKPDFGLYTYLSTRVFEFLAEKYTPKIEVGSIDECYLDVTDIWKPYGSPRNLAKHMQDSLWKELRLPASFGIADNKFVAKMATGINKPKGITVIKPGSFLEVCGEWPVISFFGIGKATAQKLNKLGINTIGDLAKAKIDDLKPQLGVLSANYISCAQGNGTDELNYDHNELKGIGNEVTFQDYDKIERNDILQVLAQLSELIAQRMKNRNFMGGVIAVMVKVSGGKEIRRTGKQATLTRPIYEYKDILKEAINLFDEIWTEGSIKFIGIRMGKLVDKYDATYQTSLLEQGQEVNTTANLIGNLNRKFRTKVAVSLAEHEKELYKKQKQSRYIESDRILKHYDVKDEKSKG